MKRSDLDEAVVLPRPAMLHVDRRAALSPLGVLQDGFPAAAPAPEILGSRAFYLFLPYYTPPDADRAAELAYCLKRNLDSGLFARIVLMIDDDTPLPFQDWRLLGIRLTRRPTYLDWIRTARRLCPGHVAVLLNSDIHVDGSFASIAEIFQKDDRAFVALSRFDKKGDDLVPHANPHWSQDSWAYVPMVDDDTSYDAQLEVPLGVPRCDNKIAYLFGIQGYTVYNPFPFVRTVHVHETGRRYYNKKGDRRIIGGVAYVHPSAALTEPAGLDLDIWTIRTAQLKKVRINASIEKWAEEERLEGQQWPTWIAHDADWQHPAITEQHAFLRMREELPPTRKGRACLYLAFPFATLIDLHKNLGLKHPRMRELQGRLDALAEQAKGYERVIGVCQHIRAKEFASLFANAGVTDLFWSHAVKDDPAFVTDRKVNVHPFPLYPVQQVPRGLEDIGRPRRWLYSFVGAHNHKGYLTQVRAMILDKLANDPRGCVMGRDGWHYEKVVYQAQVLGKVASSEPGLVNDDASAQFRDLLDQSVFSLCPSGTGPNSIRLWEAMINGSIPVILSDTWAAPGDPELWQAATLRVAETAEAIAALPGRLATIAADPERLAAMRRALTELARRHGPEGFVGDVLEAMASSLQ
jgi:Exostosin family